MKILCAPYNYGTGNKPASVAFLMRGPALTTLPDCALLREGWPFFVPDWDERFVAQVQLAVRIDRLGKDIAERFAHRYYHAVSVAVQFSSEAHPATPFDGCVAVGVGTVPVAAVSLSLDVDGQRVQAGEASQMLFTVDQIIAQASRFMTLKTGDIVLCGPPCPGTPVREGQSLTGYLNEEPLLHVRVK